MSEKEMTVEEYKKYFDLFDPVDYNERIVYYKLILQMFDFKPDASVKHVF